MKEKTKGSGNVGTEALNLSKKELLNLGEQYLKIRNYDNAMKYLSRAVLQGSSRAGTKLFELAKAFYKKQDFGPAFRAFQLLADKGHGESSLYLGKMYERGLGVKASLQKSFDCYAVAYQQGIPMGAYLAGKLMTTDALRRGAGYCHKLVPGSHCRRRV
jgi:TPR repeat protein